MNALSTMIPRLASLGLTRTALVLVGAVVALALTPSRLAAQATPAPPENLTYQGFLVDGNGVALGNTAPKNYDVIFKIFNDQSGGVLLWAEQQTVTVDKGYFSVLLGEGASTGDPRPALSSLFKGPTASDRFVGVTVKGIGAGGSNVDILPRLRLLSSPYSFLAQNAVRLVQSTGADLITSSGNSVTVSGPVTANSFTGTGTGLTALNADNITSGTLASARLATHLTGNRTFSGNVGIGTTSPGSLLSLGTGLANTKLALYEGGGPGYGLGIQGGQFRLHLDAATARFSFLNAPAGTEMMTLQGNGRLGIGIDNPGARLHVMSPDYVAGILSSANPAGTWLALQNSSAGGRYWQMISSGAGNGEGAGKLLIGTGTSAAGTGVAMTVDSNGHVGIGTSSPGSRLDVVGGVRARGGAPGGNGVNNNGYAFAGNFGDNDSGMFSNTDGRVSLYSNSIERLRVEGANMYFYTLPNIGDRRNMQYNDSNGQIGYDNSSRRYKINISPLEDDFSALLKARAMTYTRPASPDFWEIGFIAEDFHDLGLRKLVDYDQEGRPDGINYEKICLYLTENAKRHEQDIVGLKSLQETQEKQLVAQRQEIDDLKAQLAALEKLVRTTAGIRAESNDTAGLASNQAVAQVGR